ncbi:CitMHS family transporter [Alkaliphilus oremlandii]|uniref:Citrate/H+ symporter, CitMHS family n=1 Tax=Alkaliphilus oremlandii (strain OhILAs) TaxID=350688 RepID=A8MHR3_ALKOO|nr:citrate:proton symporter [Alkaliphilus oremlandii]ABW19345.1 citrate/H+ symporter, CitMHS family [Alkaliphilus oremlandii OhILAs]
MLAMLGFLTVIFMLALVMSKKASATVALIGVPVVIGAIASFFSTGEGAYNILDIGKFITSGIGTVAATGVMFIFSILFFGILTDAGTFRPIIKKILNIIGTDPIKIAMGTAILAMIVHLDGSGAVTFLICIPALLPVYDAVGMSRTTLATIVALAAGTMNIVPWGGPTIRAATAMEMNVMDLFNPLVIPVICGLATVLLIAFILGKKEKGRLGESNTNSVKEMEQELTEEQQALLRPHLFGVNVILILVAIVGLIMGGKYGIKPEVVFMISFVLSIVINYPEVSMQKSRVDAHAKSAILMASVLFAAGAFTGIMKGSGMITAMSEALVAIIPASAARYFAVITGVISMPSSLLFDPDSFYFGVLPVLSSTASRFGIEGISIARAAILGQMTTGFPVSPLTPATFLLVGLAGVDFGEHQKKTIPYSFTVTIVMLVASVVFGAIRI